MKSFFKWVLILAGALIVLFICAIGILFVPAVQRSIAERVLTADDRSVEIESIAIGLRQVKARRVVVSQPGVEVHLDELHLKWSPMALAFGGEVEIQQLLLKDLDVKLSRQPEAGDVPADAPAVVSDEPDMRFAGLALPEVPLTIDRLSGNGSLELADGSMIVWQTSADGIAPGKTGELTIDGTFSKEGLKTGLAASLVIDQHDAGWRGAQLNADVTAEVDQLAAPVALNVQGSLERGPGREDISLTVSRPLNAATREELFSLQASLEGQQILRGSGTLNFDQDALLPLTGAGSVPDHEVRGSYDFSYRIPSKTGRATIDLQGDIGNWGIVGDDLAALPTMEWEARFAGEWDADSLVVRDLNVAAGEESKAKSVELSLSESFRYSWNSPAGATEDASALKESITVVINEFQLGLVNPVIAPQRLDGVMSGRLSVDVDAGGNRLDVRTIEKLRIAGLGFTNAAGEAVLSDTRLELEPTVSADGSMVQVGLADLELASAAGSLVRSQMTVGYDPATKQVDSTGELLLDVTAWLTQPVMKGAAGSIPAGSWAAAADWTVRHDLAGNRMTPEAISVTLSESNTTHLELKLLQSFTADLGKAKDNPIGMLSGVDGDLIELKVFTLPLGLADPWVTDYTIAGTIETAAMRLGKNGEDWALNTDTPLHITALSVADSGGALLRNVEITAASTVRSRDEGVFVEIDSLDVSSDGLGMVTAEARIGLVPGDSSSFDIQQLNVGIDLPRLFSQPALVDLNNFLTGTLNLDVTGRPAPGGKVVARVSGKDWRLREPLRAISTIEGELAVDWAADGKLHLQGPARLEGPGGVSSVTLSGWLDPGESQKRFDLNLSGPRVVGEDLLLLAGAFSNPAAVQSPGKAPGGGDAPPATATDFPFWGEWQGQLTAGLDTILHSGLRIDGAETEVNLTHRQLSIPYLRGMLGESQISGAVEVTYNPVDPTPYEMRGNLSLPDFDVGRYLKESTGQTPVVEGVFNLATEFFANGVDAAELMRRVRGEINLNGQNGLMRVLAATGRQESIGMVGAVSSLLGSKVRELRVMNDLIRFLEVIDYEKLTLRAVRTDQLDIDLTELSVVGNELRLQGNGGIRYQEGVNLLNQQLRVSSQLEARGEVAKLFSDLGLLRRPAEPTDDFLPGPSFMIGGTAGSPDFSSLMKIIERAAVGLVTGREPPQTQSNESATEQQDAAPTEPVRPEEAIRGLLDGFLR